VRFSEDNAYAAKLLAPVSGWVLVIDATDGFRASFANGDNLHLRPSGNAPELRCYVESNSQLQAESLCGTYLARIPKNQ